MRSWVEVETLALFTRSRAIDISLHQDSDAAELVSLIRQARDAKQRDRLRAVELAIAGEPTDNIMRMLGRSRGFVQRWCYVYRDQGLSAVSSKAPPGRPPKLPSAQHEMFRRRVLAGPVEGDGICALRGRDLIRILEDEFFVRYELSGLYHLLHRLNLSVLVPRPQHRKSDPQAMRQWVDQAPFLSKNKGSNTPASVSPCGSRTKRGSASKAR